MQEKPRVVVSKTRRAETAAREFTFMPGDIPAANGAMGAYRANAWKEFKKRSLPDVTLDAWRRTDLRSMPVEQFVLPEDQAYLDLPAVPAELLKPLIADQHGGQIILMPGGSKIDLDVALARAGVVFTDLRTAQAAHAELVARMLGKTVHAEEGKFAALAGALARNGIVLYVPKHLQVQQPLHSILWGPGSSLAHISHLLVYVDEGASVTYVHECASPTEGKDALHAGVVEIKVMEGASLKFVELQPNNRIKLLVSQAFSWLPDGPIQRFFNQQAHNEFFRSRFDRPGEFMLVVNGMLSRSSSTAIVERLKRIAKEFSDIHNDDVSLPLGERTAMSLLVAIRHWELQAFTELRRKKPTNQTRS